MPIWRSLKIYQRYIPNYDYKMNSQAITKISHVDDVYEIREV